MSHSLCSVTFMHGLLPPDLAEFLDLNNAADAFYRLPAEHQAKLLEWVKRASSAEERTRKMEIALRTLAITEMHLSA
jgi:Bacteriocin-protection, YdeI or OmpD-Associated